MFLYIRIVIEVIKILCQAVVGCMGARQQDVTHAVRTHEEGQRAVVQQGRAACDLQQSDTHATSKRSIRTNHT